ncbi:MAG: MBL fold metallo-hydrolase [Clostridia bacterium]|nr:MBL fold metallo-hydrolase [Clostridia bacterium]
MDEGIYRLRIPFEELNTTVYLALCDSGAALIDAASDEGDVVNYVLPALEKLGIPLEVIKLLLLTHSHGDHAGGLDALRERIPHAKVMSMTPFDVCDFMLLRDGDLIDGRLEVVHLPGHTEQSCGYFDRKTKTLLSGDCLQLAGVGKYVHGINDGERYRASVRRLMDMDLFRIVAAHEYVPLGSIAEGQEAVKRYLEACIALSLDAKQ